MLMTWQIYVLPITLSPSLVLDKLKPGWKTWTRIYRVHTLRPLLSLVPHPLLWVLTSKCSREHHLPGHMVISGSHGHFQESLTVEEVKGCSSEGQTTDISPLWEMRPRPGRAFQRFRSQPLSPPNHILKHFYYQEGSACKFQILPLQGLLELWHERKSRETG